jgi:hypothetical protein
MIYRKFLYWTCTALAAYLLFNLIIWKLFTSDMIANPDCVCGDMTHLAYIMGSMTCRMIKNDLPIRHLEIGDYNGQKIDMVTIGDSFSNGGGTGRNSYYQDYIASTNGFNVLNIPQFRDIDKITTVSILNNNGFLDRLKTKYVLIEYAEKESSKNSPKEIDLEKKYSERELKKYETVSYDQKREYDNRIIKFDFISQANFKHVWNNIFYSFSEKAPGCSVFRVKLKGDYFTAKNSDILLFHKDDISGIRRTNNELILQLNNKLNILSDKLAAKGIKLYFMPCADKYNLYSKYIIGNKYPKSIFFEEFRKLPKRYGFIDTKAILLKEVENGEKDLYYADDTHWSWKASKKIFECVTFH